MLDNERNESRVQYIFNILFFSESSKYFIQADDRIGGTYKKALYFEYTDESFSILKNRTEDQLHLGYLGPVIRGAVGDTIQVVFKNMVGCLCLIFFLRIH